MDMMFDASQSADLEAFWVHASTKAKVQPIPGVLGQNVPSSLRPPAFSMGDGTPASADRLAQLIVSGAKRATSSYGPSYVAEGVAYPEVGDLSILLDGADRPVALLRNRQVETYRFCDVPAEVSDAEGEGSYAQWVDEHRAVFAAEAEANGDLFDETGIVVVEYFDVLFVSERYRTERGESTKRDLS